MISTLRCHHGARPALSMVSQNKATVRRSWNPLMPPWAHTTRVSTDDRLSLNVTDNPARLDVGYQRFLDAVAYRPRDVTPRPDRQCDLSRTSAIYRATSH